MRRDYYIAGGKGEMDLRTVSDRLASMADLVAVHGSEEHGDKDTGRNLWTRTVDAVLGFVNRNVRPLHVVGVTATAVVFYVYARIIALTTRLVTCGETTWPNLQAPCVVALWHGDAPSLLLAFAMRRPKAPAVILVASDPRGDSLGLLCRMVGFEVVRTDGRRGDWSELVALAERLNEGACAIITADGGGPAKIAKVGAVALASATGVPIVPLSADSHPALQQSHKWDAARNPLPFSSITVWLGAPRRFEPFVDREAMEAARMWLEETLNTRS